MDGFCRSCLVHFNESTDLIQYTEKNRRLFVYSTGLQVKRNDTLTFQLCKECYQAMKTACSFKKTCRTSEKRLKSYFACKEIGDAEDFCTFLKNNDDAFRFRLPMTTGNSTPANYKREEDNESTCTSIQNFMTDILQAEEIPDNEARIIREVIEEEADVLDDSLDSHWLQDDVSLDTDYRLDFSPFSTPRSANNDSYTFPKKIEEHVTQVKKKHFESVQKTPETEIQIPAIDGSIKNEKCTIDSNLEYALKNKGAQKVYLAELLATPPVLPDISAPPTPLISNILFGDKIDGIDQEDKDNILYENETANDNVNKDDIDVIDEFLKDDIDSDEKDYFVLDKDLEDIAGINIDQDLIIFNEDRNILPESTEDQYCINNFYCKMCNRQFINLKALKIHYTKQHKSRIVHLPIKKDRAKYICDYCGKVFASLRSIKKHIINHMKPSTYECEHCTLKFSSEKGLKFHKLTHTTNKDIDVAETNTNKKYVCNICGKTLSTCSNYKVHMRRHDSHYTSSCQECGKGFFRSCDLLTHMRRHTGEKPYACIHCPRSFSRTDVLNRHMKCHTDERLYPCSFCSKKFAAANEVKAHQIKSKKCLKHQLSIAKG